MFVPLGYLVGVALLLLTPDALQVLPGSGSVVAAGLAAPSLLVPGALARWCRRRLLADLLAGGRVGRRVFTVLRLLPASVPTVLLLFLAVSGWSDLADQLGGASFLATMALLLLPLLIAEVTRLVAETPLREQMDELGYGAGALPLRRRLGMLVMMTTPWLLLPALVDLVTRWREFAAFLLITSPGHALSAIGAGLLLAVVLPLVFCATLGVSRALPPHLAGPLGDTAAALGFRRSALRVMDTGRRLANALLLGVLPWPRYLVLTDALLGVLDLFALRGVVAHEVGHARGRHLLAIVGTAMIVLPLGSTVAMQADWFETPWVEQTFVSLLVLAIAVLAMHKIAHRFEHEADVLSAVALGGAAPCIRALRFATQFGDLSARRASFLHPSEERRVSVLLAWESEPAFRERFVRRGRRLRLGLIALTVTVTAAAGWSWWAAWPVERALWHFRLGEFAAARAAVQQAAGQVRAGFWEEWQAVTAEIEAAVELAGPTLAVAAEEQFAADAWRRGLEVAGTAGAAAARPWFSLATWTDSTPLRRSVAMYCVAVERHDEPTAQRLWEHLATLSPPAELLAALRR
ncbi:MAG: M48 family metalloprotease [Planctomycetes bacterium]|nr:M48 family metalloprotease [Planctomycetota bacterium]